MISLYQLVERAVAALIENRPAEAAADLHAVWSDADLRASEDLRDIRARVSAMLAQALIEAGEPEKADAPLNEALELSRDLADEASAQVLAELKQRLDAQLRERRSREAEAQRLARLAETPVESLLASATSFQARADVLIRKATAEIEAGRSETAEALARNAVAIATDQRLVREEVIARLTVARAQPAAAREMMLAALAVAENAREFNLVGAIARAADIAGVELPRQMFADRDVQ